MCTNSQIPTEKNQKKKTQKKTKQKKQQQQEIKETCAKVLPASRDCHPNPQPPCVASFCTGKNVILLSVLKSSAHLTTVQKIQCNHLRICVVWM